MKEPSFFLVTSTFKVGISSCFSAFIYSQLYLFQPIFQGGNPDVPIAKNLYHRL